jgi:hypothetical protein
MQLLLPLLQPHSLLIVLPVQPAVLKIKMEGGKEKTIQELDFIFQHWEQHRRMAPA